VLRIPRMSEDVPDNDFILRVKYSFLLVVVQFANCTTTFLFLTLNMREGRQNDFSSNFTFCPRSCWSVL
jgi:hypothetical protein